MSFFTLVLLGVVRLTGEKNNELICYDTEGLGNCTSDPGNTVFLCFCLVERDSPVEV